MLTCPNAWPPSQPTCLKCFLLESMTPNMSLNLSSGSLPPIWNMPIRNGENRFIVKCRQKYTHYKLIGSSPRVIYGVIVKIIQTITCSHLEWIRDYGSCFFFV